MYVVHPERYFFEKKKRGKIFVEKELCYIFATDYMKGM